jgi:agmatinase
MNTQAHFWSATDVKIVQADSGKIEAIHSPTAKKFQITKGVSVLLNYLQTPRSFDEIKDSLLSQYKEDEIIKTVNFLVQNHLILTENTKGNFHIRKSNYTLFGLQEYSNTTPKNETEVVLVGIPFGYGNGTDTRCSWFPSNLRSFLKSKNVELNNKQEPVDFRFVSSLADLSNLEDLIDKNELKDWGDLHIGSHEYPHVVYQKISDVSSELIGKKIKPFFIGGDHSITFPILRGVDKALGKDFQVLQFDAHTDTYSVGSKGESSTHHHGNFMTEAMKLPHLKKVTQLGIRGLSNYARSLSDNPKQKIFWADEVKHKLWTNQDFGIDNSLPVYITFDIDFLDGAFAPGTATPVYNGFTYNETALLLEKILPPLNVIGFDIVEVNPKISPEINTIEIASNLILLLSNFAQRRI